MLKFLHREETDTKARPGWKLIENPMAREMARLLYKMCGQNFDPHDPRSQIITLADVSTYRLTLRRRLREGNFMSLLSAGPESLPDLREKLHPLQALFDEAFKPRDTKSLLDKLARNLEWYIEPEKPRPFPWLLLVQCLASIVSLGLLASLFESSPGKYSFVSLIVSQTLNVGVYSYQITTGALLSGERHGNWKYVINCAELYLYLVELHTEQALPAGPDRFSEARLLRVPPPQVRSALGSIDLETATGPGESAGREDTQKNLA